MSADLHRLSSLIHQLGDALGETIAALSGARILELEEEIRRLAKANRAHEEGAAQKLENLVRQLSAHDAYEIAMAFTTYFELVNLAEEDERARILRERREAQKNALARGQTAASRLTPKAEYDTTRFSRETIEAAIVELKQRGVTPEQLQKLLNALSIELVFTAHPTESKRRTILSKLRRIAQELRRAPDSAQAVNSAVRREITSLWLTDRSRTSQPAVSDEARTGLFYFNSTLWEVVPQLYADLELALQAHYPGVKAPERWLTFGSWIGGDRDGNPNVTAAVTAEILQMHQRAALEKIRDDAHELSRHLSISKRRDRLSLKMNSLIERILRENNAARNTAQRYPNEPYRAVLSAISQKASAARDETITRPLYPPDGGATPPLTAKELRDTLNVVADSLKQGRAAALADGELRQLHMQAGIFGTHVARLDLRQHSDWHQAAIADVLGALSHLAGHTGRHALTGYAEMDEAQKVAALDNALAAAKPLALERFGLFKPETMNVIEPFIVAREAMARLGDEALGPYVISMTDNLSDVLEVLLLMKWCSVSMDIAPLFETLDDLDRAPAILEQMFAHPAYKKHLFSRGLHQVIMLGYSDSNKDCGYITANWALFKAQESISQTCGNANVRFTLFHGRGGSVARGGGPAARAILSQPVGLKHGHIRITEQGEVLSTRYLNADVARRHLEQVAYGVLLASHEAQNPANVNPAWREAMERMAAAGNAAYTQMVEDDPDFISFWKEATPIDEIRGLKIASRPAFRKATKTVADLRAIPWVFSWMQSRFNFPGWYGLGTALQTELDAGEEHTQQLKRMYHEWHFFQSVIDNAQQSLTKADLSIAAWYASLARDAEMRARVFGRIRAEFLRAESAILRITGQTALLENEPTLQRSIHLRNPYIDPLNAIQVEMLRRLRAHSSTHAHAKGDADHHEDDAELMRAVVELTINGLSSGLRNTG